jgi:hypothetical protein
MFSEGQRTEGHFRYPGASNAITIIVDLRSEHDLKVLLKVGHADSATNMQVIGLTHRPTGFNGRRWYFVSQNGERAETLFLVGRFFRTRREAGLTYRSQSVGELDRALDRRRKLQAQLEGTGARGPARGRRRKQATEELAEIQRLLAAFESGLVLRDQNIRAQARERRRSSLERLDAARAAMAQRKDVQPEWVITTFGTLVDGLKAATTSPDTSPIPPRSASSDPGPQVNIGILQRLGFVQTGKMLGDQLGWSEAWVPEPGRRLFFIIDLRDRRRPCAVLLVCDPGRQAHQLFALKRIKGRFGRQEYCFICPHTGRQSTVIFYSEGQFFCSTTCVYENLSPTGVCRRMLGSARRMSRDGVVRHHLTADGRGLARSNSERFSAGLIASMASIHR